MILFKMAANDVLLESASSDFKCKHCKKDVVNSVKCIKCDELFHPSCLVQSARAKNAVCRHEPQNQSGDTSNLKTASDHSDPRMTSLMTENCLLRELVEKTKSKNAILNENCDLLKEKVKILLETVKMHENTILELQAKNDKERQGQVNATPPSLSISTIVRDSNKHKQPRVKDLVHVSKQTNQANLHKMNNEIAPDRQNVFTATQVSSGISEAWATRKFNEIQQLANDDGSDRRQREIYVPDDAQ